MGAFGATIDYFNLADTTWKLQDFGADPQKSNATASDEKGDVVCETVHDTSYGYSNSYAYCGTGDTSGNVVYPTIKGGQVNVIDTGNSSVISGVTVTTTNDGAPVLAVTGEKLYGPNVPTYTLNLPTISAGHLATNIGFIPDTNSRTTGSTYTFSSTMSKVMDSQGQTSCMGIHAGREEATNELVSCTAIASGVADTANGWTLDGPIASAGDNTSYGTSTANVFQNLAQD